MRGNTVGIVTALEGDYIWQTVSGTSTAGGTLQLQFAQGLGPNILAAQLFSDGTPVKLFGVCKFQYVGNSDSLPSSQYPSTIPLRCDADDPTPVGLRCDPRQTLLAALSGLDATSAYTLAILVDNPVRSGC